MEYTSLGNVCWTEQGQAAASLRPTPRMGASPLPSPGKVLPLAKPFLYRAEICLENVLPPDSKRQEGDSGDPLQPRWCPLSVQSSLLHLCHPAHQDATQLGPADTGDVATQVHRHTCLHTHGNTATCSEEHVRQFGSWTQTHPLKHTHRYRACVNTQMTTNPCKR